MYDVASVFGGSKNLGQIVKNSAAFDSLIRKGIPLAASDHLKSCLQLTEAEFASAIGISLRTLLRRKKNSTRLPPESSDRLYRLARIFAFTVEVLGSEKHAREWLHSLQTGLGNRVPLEMMKTDAGAVEVENLLGRIKHGIVL